MHSFYFILSQILLLHTSDVYGRHHRHHGRRGKREDSFSQRNDPVSNQVGARSLYPYGFYNPYYGMPIPSPVYPSILSPYSINEQNIAKIQKSSLTQIKDYHKIYLGYLSNVYRNYFKNQYTVEEFLKLILFSPTDVPGVDYSLTFDKILKEFKDYLELESKSRGRFNKTEIPEGPILIKTIEILPGKDGKVNTKVINESASIESGASQFDCALFAHNCHSCVISWCFFCESTGQCLPYGDFAKNSFTGELCPIMDSFGYGTCAVKSFYLSFLIGLFVTLLLLLIISVTVLMIVNKRRRKRLYQTIEQREGELKNNPILDSD